jgi:5-methylcytosine-specific restriction endonuclease McrBC regulatory subunit McrC
MDGVGDFRPSDLEAQIDRQTIYYGAAAMLARRILQATGTAMKFGEATIWSFLINTPDVVEQAVRSILRSRLDGIKVEKRRITLEGSAKTFNPDLVFDDSLAVADVKYKLAGGDWNRADLYEVIAFAEAVHTPRAALMVFRESAGGLKSLKVGSKRVDEICWRTHDRSPEQAAQELVEDVSYWLMAPEPTSSDLQAEHPAA